MDVAAVDSLRQKFDVLYDQALVERRPQMLGALQDATGIIVKERTQVDRDLLAHAKQLRVVGRLGVGLDNIDLPACRERDIAVFPATGANATSVAEYVICASLMLLRPGAYGSTDRVASGRWPQKEVRGGRELDRKTMGVIGLGAIGQAVARLARGLGMRVIAWAPTKAPEVFSGLGVERVEMDRLLAEADIVTLHIPLTDKTRGFISKERIAAMRQGAVLINTARGGIVDDAALVDALKAGRLGGAAIDVFDAEPLPGDSVFAGGAPNLVLTPHIAGGTVESTERRGSVVAQKVSDYLAQIR
ncbi:MAG: hydroxyacid dehydrogenase [Burkholderiales bacterium]|nr:hydroxyacid dehydrogenase [Burkholderiales bacterium]